jgi:F-type H+-transporting ATPase subunit b
LFIIQSVIFLILLFVLGKFAWKPILTALNEEVSIQDASTKLNWQKKKLQILKQTTRESSEAKAERDAILKEARELKDKIVGEAKRPCKI